MSTPTVAHFASVLQSGAGMPAELLHRELRKIGIESRLFYDNGETSDPAASRVRAANTVLLRIKRHIMMNLHQRRSRIEFSSPHGVRRTPLDLFGPAPKIINLHWVSDWLDIPSFLSSVPAALPVVWSIHDLIPLTGGCHYDYGCEGFTRQCGHCPQLKFPWRWDASARYHRANQKAYGDRKFWIVGNSHWTTGQAQRSSLFQHSHFRTIPLGVDTEAFVPIEKPLARAALRLPEAQFVIGFSCINIRDKRKNLQGLIEALNRLGKREGMLLVLMGGGVVPVELQAFPHVMMGETYSSRFRCLFYSALDVFVLPSVVETFGQTGLEAMASGTPVVAFRAGGVQDFVTDGHTGLLAPDTNDSGGLAERLEWLLARPVDRLAMAHASRKSVEKSFSIRQMAEQYARLYQETIQETRGETPNKT